MQLRNETKIINRALARTNLCVEALKSRVTNEKGSIELSSVNGKELLLILQNYLIQKYYSKYNLISEEAYCDERLFFYSYNYKQDDYRTLGSLDMNKGRYYLKEYIIKNRDIFSSILIYGYDGFEEIEKEIVDRCAEIIDVEENPDSEVTLTLYQLVTIGDCLGYFDYILSSDELPNSEKHLMKEIKGGKFLIRLGDRKIYIDKFNGELILSFNEVIEFDKWCNYDVGRGLDYIIHV